MAPEEAESRPSADPAAASGVRPRSHSCCCGGEALLPLHLRLGGESQCVSSLPAIIRLSGSGVHAATAAAPAGDRDTETGARRQGHGGEGEIANQKEQEAGFPSKEDRRGHSPFLGSQGPALPHPSDSESRHRPSSGPHFLLGMAKAPETEPKASNPSAPSGMGTGLWWLPQQLGQSEVGKGTEGDCQQPHLLLPPKAQPCQPTALGAPGVLSFLVAKFIPG